MTRALLCFLLRMQQRRLERRIGEQFDPELSRRIDALVIAEDALRRATG